jgi:hypothetical protein
MPTKPKSAAQPLLLCPQCKLELRLLGIEVERPGRDLYTFECTTCTHLEVRTVRTLRPPQLAERSAAHSVRHLSDERAT